MDVCQKLENHDSAPDLSTKHLDTEDIKRLSADVLGTHIDYALQAKLSTDGGSCHAMLPCTRLSDNTRFSQAACKKDLWMPLVTIRQIKRIRKPYLSDRIIDLMRTCVIAKMAHQSKERKSSGQNN